MMDTYQNGVGLAIQAARSNGLQARIMWIDFTANIDRINTESKVEQTIAKIADAGFNTVVFDVKPLSGQVAYNSKIAPKLLEWRGKRVPADYDCLAHVAAAAKRHRLSIYTAMNAFSEGHGLLKVGPGYAKLDQQTVLYEPQPIVRIGGDTYHLSPKLNAEKTDAITVYSSNDTIPMSAADGFAVTLLPDQTIVDGFEGGTKRRGVPTIPKGGIALFGRGESGNWLRHHAAQGTRAQFDTVAQFVPISERPEQQYPLMMNINHPEVQKYELEIAREVVKNYPVDGIIYDDRLRFGGINADFSEITRQKFEHWIGKKLNWPDDVFKFTISTTLHRGIQPGHYYDAWLQFRAVCVTDYVKTVRNVISSEKRDAQLGVYAGSWYGEYPAFGNNYASVDARSPFWFSTPEYRKTGFATDLDFLITGCYYPVATTYDAMSNGLPIGSTVEAAGILTNRLVRDQCWSYAGIALSDFKGNPKGLMNALQAACGSTQGVMVFDLSHDVEPMWPVFKQAFVQPRVPPHRRIEVLRDVRRRRNLLDKSQYRDQPIPLSAGSAGTGQ